MNVFEIGNSIFKMESELMKQAKDMDRISDVKELDKPISKEITVIDSSVKKGLTEEEKSYIKEEGRFSEEVIDCIKSKEEYEIYKNADLKEVEINGKKCLIREDIDLNQKDEDGISNYQKMERGRPPITKEGKEIELHHIGQKQDSPLAELTMEQHRGVGNDVILHDKTKETEINRTEFQKERHEHWKNRVESWKE